VELDQRTTTIIRATLLAATAVLCAAALTVPTATAPDLARRSPVTTYVLRAAPGHLPKVGSLVKHAGGSVVRTLRALDAATVRLPESEAAAIRRSPDVLALSPDERLQLASTSTAGTSADYDPVADANSLFNVEQVIGARQIWKTATGAGVDVALIDSGVTPVPGLDAPAKLVNGPDLSFDSQSPDDRYLDRFGHGTHLAGIIAGHDAGVTAAGGTSDTNAFLGVAPDARIVNVKVADGRGVSDVSQVIAGIDWVVQHAHTDGLNIRVLNLSFATDSTQDYRLDPLAYAAEVAWRHGITVVTAAGNRGVTDGRLADPAMDPFVLAVGASDGLGTITRHDDIVAAFSSRGDGVRDPDLVAPGAHVQSLRVPGSAIDTAYGSTGLVGGRYFRGSGTSQSTAVVAGAAALLTQAESSLTQAESSYGPDRIKALLKETTYVLNGAGPAAQGFGLLNLRTVLSNSVAESQQSFPVSTGTGTLAESRGSLLVSLDGVELDGERDIFGNPFDSASMAALEQAEASWSGGDWNGNTWTGTGWASSSWASSSWASSSWVSSSWASSSWASSGWAATTWG
jgi:serine protease AprX